MDTGFLSVICFICRNADQLEDCLWFACSAFDSKCVTQFIAWTSFGPGLDGASTP